MDLSWFLLKSKHSKKQGVVHCIDMIRWYLWDEYYVTRVLCGEHCLWQAPSENGVLFFTCSTNKREWREIGQPNEEQLKPFIKKMASKHHIEGKIPGANYIATISLTRPCISSKWWVLEGARLMLIGVFNASLKASESGWRLSLCSNYSSSVSRSSVSIMVSHYIDSELCGPGVKYFNPLYNCCGEESEWVQVS